VIYSVYRYYERSSLRRAKSVRQTKDMLANLLYRERPTVNGYLELCQPSENKGTNLE
jgi:hypothetical protein